MTVRLSGAINDYVGLSTDEKPDVDVPEGSRFFERDTGAEFRFNGSAWGEVGRSVVLNRLLLSALEGIQSTLKENLRAIQRLSR